MITAAPEKRIAASRTELIIDQPFFGMLALRLRVVEDPSCDTAWTDGKSLGFSPDFVDSLSHDHLTGLVGHEVLHCACGHPWRRGDRDPQRWNIACDFVVNLILVDAGFVLPDGALLDRQYEGKSAEWIYDRLPTDDSDEAGDDSDQGDADEAGDQGEAGGAGDSEPNPQGEVRDAPDDATEDSATEGDWSAATQQAAKVAAAQDKLGAGLERFAAQQAKPRVDWRGVLRRFVQDSAAADYSWKRPSPRFVARGMYLPALHSESLGAMVVAVDTSCSIDEVTLAQFSAELCSIVEDTEPARVHVLYCDTRVHRQQTFEQGDSVTLEAVGAGGTEFGPVFEAIDELDEAPACCVYLTDLEPWDWNFPVPDVPTLWASCKSGKTAPFGEVVDISGER